MNLQDNESLLAQVNEQLSIASDIVAKKMEESCDEACKAKCDKDADEMIRELKNPLHDITWNCKNNYDVYTTDYDPEHSHFDRISMDVMATQRTISQIQKLEEKIARPTWNWQVDETDTDRAVLSELKKELGLNPTEKLPNDLAKMNVRESIYDAVQAHAAPTRSPGFIKAYGLKE